MMLRMLAGLLREGERDLERAVRAAGMVDTASNSNAPMALSNEPSNGGGEGDGNRFVRSVVFQQQQQQQQQSVAPLQERSASSGPLPFGVSSSSVTNAYNTMQPLVGQSSSSSLSSSLPAPVGDFGRDLDAIQRKGAERRRRIDEQAQFLRDIGK
jgi:hypothetical protein